MKRATSKNYAALNGMSDDQQADDLLRNRARTRSCAFKKGIDRNGKRRTGPDAGPGDWRDRVQGGQDDLDRGDPGAIEGGGNADRAEARAQQRAPSNCAAPAAAPTIAATPQK